MSSFHRYNTFKAPGNEQNGVSGNQQQLHQNDPSHNMQSQQGADTYGNFNQVRPDALTKGKLIFFA